MKNNFFEKTKRALLGSVFLAFLIVFLAAAFFFIIPEIWSNRISNIKEEGKKEEPKDASVLSLDKALYNRKLLELANNPPDPIVYKTVKVEVKDPAGKQASYGAGKKGNPIYKTEKIPLDPQPIIPHLWPVKTAYPNAGAILPFNRIVAYYGNLYSKNMGVLGQYPEDEMSARLLAEAKKWEIADPSTPVLPALHYIVTVAQGAEGKDGKYRARMPDSEIQKVLKMAQKINALVFLDVQVGFSDLRNELPLLLDYLKLPQVHLGIDPEFSMKNGIRPGKIVGTYDAADVNYAANFLAQIVRENNLTPKILVVHRYTQNMLTNYQNIKPLPEVEIVINMDGWGEKAKKISTYKQFIYPEPVQFTGFKLFYKNDTLTPGSSLFTPEELLKLNPIPIYIQYQ